MVMPQQRDPTQNGGRAITEEVCLSWAGSQVREGREAVPPFSHLINKWRILSLMAERVGSGIYCMNFWSINCYRPSDGVLQEAWYPKDEGESQKCFR